MLSLSARSLVLVCLAIACISSPASGQTTGAPPAIIMGATTDPAKLQWLGVDASKALADLIQQLKSGSVLAYAFSVSADGKLWASRGAPKDVEFFGGTEDLVRKSLEHCEYVSGAPCFLLSVNGRDARDSSNGLAVQPKMLARDVTTFDAERVPFVRVTDRIAFRGYISETRPRAFIVTASGLWLWRTGETIFQAIASAQADCLKTFPNHTCILYAVNDRLVFAQ